MLLWAHLRDNNQNAAKIPAGTLAKTHDQGLHCELREGGRIDSAQRSGMVALQQAIDLACSRAADGGIGYAGAFNFSTSTGALGWGLTLLHCMYLCYTCHPPNMEQGPMRRYWAEQIAQQGLIGIVMAQSPEYVAPHGATEAVFGTNPIAIAFPTGGDGHDPVLLDMATSAAAWCVLTP